ncbi:hypothetical protein DES32_1146 [Methylovirgula ligni]|uniref:PilZ domain-containing protein n=1 Tax=Methylovirgula ligni TaxID=569860 RepID=A0A3D9YXP6_9HYPH|nr:hypothetical protein DES32_1146 [Methylovirgula ligni]
MDTPTKPSHRFNIWSLVNPGEVESRPVGGPKAGVSASVTGQPQHPRQSDSFIRGANDRRRPSTTVARPTMRPFSGKCVLPNGAELTCVTQRVTPERIVLIYNEPGGGKVAIPLNMKVGIDLEYFGLVQGVVRDQSESGFSIAPDIVYHEKIVARLAELHAGGLDLENERDNIERLMARITLRNPACVYRLVDSDTTLYRAKIALLSHKVATLRTAQIQRAGTRILLGWRDAKSGKVLRSFESGFTVEFDQMIESLDENLRFD